MCRFHSGNCKQYVGQHVRVHTSGGIHQGVVQKVTSKGLYLQPAGAAPVIGQLTNDFATADGGGEVGAESVYFPYRGYGYRGYGGYGYRPYYNPAAFFVPFLAILALSSLFFW